MFGSVSVFEATATHYGASFSGHPCFETLFAIAIPYYRLVLLLVRAQTGHITIPDAYRDLLLIGVLCFNTFLPGFGCWGRHISRRLFLAREQSRRDRPPDAHRHHETASSVPCGSLPLGLFCTCGHHL